MKDSLKMIAAAVSPRSIRSVLVYIVALPLSVLSRWVPKKNIIVFGARNGRAYDWNSRYLYEYVVQRGDDRFLCYWVTRNRNVYRDLSEQGLPVLLRSSWRGFVTLLRAKYAVISSSITDIDSNLLGGATIIQVGHGLGIKKIGYAFFTNFSGRGVLLSGLSRLFCLATRLFDRQCRFHYAIAPSESFVDRMMEDYQVGRDKLWVTGEPRNDVFFKERSPKTSRIISFLPTHRYEMSGCTNDAFRFFSDYGFNAEQMDSLMEELDATFYMKFHHLHAGQKELVQLFEKHPRLKIYEEEDAVPLLLKTDLLISDYSSVFCNFLHLNRPLIFYFFDHDEYTSIQGITSLLDNPPGSVCKNWNEVEAAIRRAFTNDEFCEQREALRKQLYPFDDGRNCERIYEKICELED